MDPSTSLHPKILLLGEQEKVGVGKSKKMKFNRWDCYMQKYNYNAAI